MSLTKPRATSLLTISLALACVESPERAPTGAFPTECLSHQPSRWTGPWSDAPTLMGDIGTTGAAGVAVADSELFVFQRSLGEVWRLDLRGTRLGSFGREGPGPGEVAVRGWTRVLSHGRASWLGIAGDTVFLFDGNQLQFFTTVGTYLGRARAFDDALRGTLFFSKRIRPTPAGTLIDVEQRRGASRSLAPQARPYTLFLLTDTATRPVLSIELPPLPTDEHGAQHQSLREAQPVWDMAGSCIVVSDGSSPWLLVSSLDGSLLDTVRYPLPRRTVAPDDDETSRLQQRLGVARRRSVPPALPLGVRDLSVDPDGWVWILPVQPTAGLDGRVEVLRVPIGMGRTVFDTVPAFPIAFGSDGAFFGVTRDSAGYRRLGRFPSDDRGGKRPI